MRFFVWGFLSTVMVGVAVVLAVWLWLYREKRQFLKGKY